MRKRYIDWLFDDCLELIFKQLREDHRDISSLSLVCKRFLTITNRLKTSLIVKELSSDQFTRLIQRYPNLKSINIKEKLSNKVVGFIRQILSSGIELDYIQIPFAKIPCGNDLRGMGMSMKSLKTLVLNYSWSDDDLIVVTDLFPCVEDLKIVGINRRGSTSITDHGIGLLAKKLKNLVKINLENCEEITDQSLKSLSSNGHNFMEIVITDCPKLTETGVEFMMQHSFSKLTSLHLDLDIKHRLTLKSSISYARKLEDIHICGVSISDEALISLANSCHTLKKIYFAQSPRHTFTIRGLKILLLASPSLESLEPGVYWLTDEYILEISQYLSTLNYINLNNNEELTNVTFYTLTKRCPLLETILMYRTRVGINEEGPVLVSHKNLYMKHLSLSSSELMDDNTLISFCSICPNLESLYLARCDLLTDKGISEIVRICSKLRFLDVTGLNVSNFLGANGEVSPLKLKIVKAFSTKICDMGMKSIGMRCPDLEELYIDYRKRVTRYGVEKVVKNCKNIKTIYMRRRMLVNKEYLDWVVKMRPSLQIINGEFGDFFF